MRSLTYAQEARALKRTIGKLYKINMLINFAIKKSKQTIGEILEKTMDKKAEQRETNCSKPGMVL